MSGKKRKRDAVVGVDEAGRGCWAGPVVAAAVWTADKSVRKQLLKDGITDSKQVNEKERERLFEEVIKNNPKIKYAIGLRDAEIIDKVNILQATLQSMDDAVDDLLFTISEKHLKAVRIDGNKVPPKVDSLPSTIDVEAIVGGDGSDVSIGAASIVAKVFRDRLMKRIDLHHPHYGFANHKGYGVKEHQEALKTLPPIPKIHRFSYKPIKKLKTVPV